MREHSPRTIIISLRATLSGRIRTPSDRTRRHRDERSHNSLAARMYPGSRVRQRGRQRASRNDSAYIAGSAGSGTGENHPAGGAIERTL